MLAALTFSTTMLIALAQDASPPSTTSTPAEPAAPAMTTSTTATTPKTEPVIAKPAARKRLLVLDFRNDGVEERTVLIIRDALATHLTRNSTLEVISTEDVRRSLDVEATKAALGCDVASCMAEIANALGADYIVFGNIGTLGGLLVGDMSLLEAQSSRSIGRESFEVRSIEDLPRGIRDAGTRLMTSANVGVTAPSTGPSIFLLTGVGVAALGLACTATGAVFASGAYDVIKDTVSDDKTKDTAESDFGTYTALWVGGAVVTAAGAGLMIYSMVE